MSQSKRDYDSTVARIAGNIFGSITPVDEAGNMLKGTDAKVRATVEVARAIVAEVKRTEPAQEAPK